MIKSMTGYGRGESSGEHWSFAVEMKAVNHRFSEVVVRMPRMYAALEDQVKKAVTEKAARGRVDVFISVENQEGKNKNVKVDKELALAYYNSLRDLGETLQLAGDANLMDVARFPDVIVLEEAEEDLEQLAKTLNEAVTTALEQLIQMRVVEGQRLQEDLLYRIKKLRDLRDNIKARAPGVVTEYKEKLHARIKDLLDSVEVDENRLANEVAFFADRGNITEELVRLQSHLDQFENALESKEPIGRKLDFLVQEMNREVNTIGSKANDLTIANFVITAKSEIEKIREQVQNIE